MAIVLIGGKFRLSPIRLSNVYPERIFSACGESEVSANLRVTAAFVEVGLTREFNFLSDHHETPNEGGPWSNEVDVWMVQLPEMVTGEGRECAVLIGGFKQAVTS